MSISAPTDISDLLFWHKGDAGVTQSAGSISQWADQSGNGYHLVQSGAGKPTVGATQNGHATVQFVYTSSQFFSFIGGGNPLSGADGCHMFAFLCTVNDPPSDVNGSGLWAFGNGSAADHYPYTNGYPYSGFGRGDRPQLKDPSYSLLAWHVLSIQLCQDMWSCRINWENLRREAYVDGEYIPLWATNATVGVSANGTSFFHGFMGELVCFSRPLTFREEFDMMRYLLVDRWAVFAVTSPNVRMTAMRGEVLYDSGSPAPPPVESYICVKFDPAI